jgi:HlyD family secretion protein
MIRTIGLPILGVLGIVLAIYTVRASERPIPATQPVAMPPQTRFDRYVAGAGLIEASSENIELGTGVSGLVTEVLVGVGDAVQRGQPLLKIDTRDLEAQLMQRKAMLAAEQSSLAQLKAQPRAEDIPPAEARLASARADLGDAQAKLDAYLSISDKRAITEEELTRRSYAVEAAKARFDEQEAALAKLKAGAWQPDVDVAVARVRAAEADLQAVEVEIDRRSIRAPIDGQVLQSKILAGEYAMAGVLATPLMLVGDVRTLHVRVDVDENDAWRIQRGARAEASVRGNGNIKVDLSFVRIEPFIVPKKSLTGDSSERVDTRVLQLIYSFPADKLPVYVGQQMDVFIEDVAESVQ